MKYENMTKDELIKQASDLETDYYVEESSNVISDLQVIVAKNRRLKRASNN